MGKKPNPAIIGAFVLGAIALAVLGVLVFGSGQYFKRVNHWVMYFPGSVNGLSVGAPVKFRGVQFGTVTNIELVFTPNNAERQVSIPVYVETDPSKINFADTDLRMGDAQTLEDLVGRGLRAQLQSQSLVTGLLFVQIDFFPDTAVRYVLPQPSTPPEVPTIPTTLEQASTAAKEIIDELRNIKLGPVVQQASDALAGINQLVNSPAVKQTLDQMPATVRNVNAAVASANATLRKLDGRIDPMSAQLSETLVSTQRTLTSIQSAASSAQTLIAPGSPLDHDLRQALQQFSRAAQSINLLADYLERNPSALIYGRDVQSAPKEGSKP